MFLKYGCSSAFIGIIIGIYFLPSPIDPEPFIFERPPPALVGPLMVNKKLSRGQRLFEGLLRGPESFTADETGNLYTGTVDGKLWRIRDGQASFITQMGKNLSECGVDGIPFKFLNGLELSRNGTIYFTDSSSKWGRRHHRYEVIETNHLGRLLEYDPVTRTARTLLDGLYMANGIVISPQEDYILIAETSICRILRYWITGDKAGVKEVFMDNMPGYPDNIRVSTAGTYRVGFATTRFPGFFTPFLDAIGPYPAIKRFIAKVIPLSAYGALLRKHGLVLEVSNTGEILESFHDPDGSVTWAISDVYEHNGKLYLGSTDLPFLVVIH
ncbi:adipocyte plasma membrane-associated protein-like isoform X3 [Pleurodeles waltl]|uniref:adipocyte plasma membrane-associated protein-like isoform X3 n=1 Tax=Pleurodeles waltl TaxID=8319 RepID=UPI003709498D